MAGTSSLPPIEGRFTINLVENRNNELLFLKRSPAARIGPGQWGFPSGHIEPGETPEQCSLRELREEIGTDYKLKKARMFGPVRDTYYGGKYELFLFHYQWLEGNIELNHEHTGFAWVSKEGYKAFDVVDGIDEDIHYLGIWPDNYLNRDRLPGKNP